MRPLRLFGLTLGLLTSASLVACGGKPLTVVVNGSDSGVSPDGSRSSSPTADSGKGQAPSSDATVAADTSTVDGGAADTSVPTMMSGSCAAPPAGSLHAYENPANGTISGSDVSGTICNAGAAVLSNNNGTFLQIGSYSDLTTMTYANPSDATGLTLDILVPLPSTAAGAGSSAGAVNCGNVELTYVLPLPPGVDCDAGAPPQCPAFCSSGCSGQSCTPCEPNPPVGAYAASGQTGGICAETYPQPGTLTGSWKITILSSEPYDGDAGIGDSYTNVHGSIVAQVVGGSPDAGNDMATLTLTF